MNKKKRTRRGINDDGGLDVKLHEYFLLAFLSINSRHSSSSCCDHRPGTLLPGPRSLAEATAAAALTCVNLFIAQFLWMMMMVTDDDGGDDDKKYFQKKKKKKTAKILCR